MLKRESFKKEKPRVGEPTRYRRGVGIVLLNKHREVFVGQRRDISQAWQMPQGGIDDDETLLDASFRELYEETGITKAKFIAKSKKWHYYDLPDYLMGKVWKGKFRGQKQKWILMYFLGKDDQDINLRAYSYQEFQNWKWLDLDKLLDIAVPFKKHIYKSVLEEFEPLIKSMKI